MTAPIADMNGTRADLASLGAQVKGLENDYTDLKVAVVGVDRKLDTGLQNINAQLNTAITGINTQFTAAINSINAKIDERGKTQWPALGVMLTAFIAFIAFAYWPIKSSQEDMRNSIIGLTRDLTGSLVSQADHFVSFREHERLIKQIEVDNGNIRRELEEFRHSR